MNDQKKPRRGRRPKNSEPYKDQLAASALGSAIVYILQAALIALASWILSFWKLSGFVDLAVLLLFVRDIEGLPEKAPRVKVIGKRIVQGLVILGLSALFHDTLGTLGSGLLVLILGLFLIQAFFDWLERMIKRLDRWLTKMGLQ